MNVGCYVAGCSRPVVVQCPGYGGDTCGRFVCAEHSDDNLCALDAFEKKKVELATAYENAARDVGKGAWRARVAGGMPFLVLLLISAAILGIANSADTALGAVIGIGVSFLAVLVATGRAERRFKEKRVEEFENQMPGFEEFYREWEKERRLKLAGVVAGIAIAAFAGALLEALSTDRRELGNAVDEELRRRGYN